MFEIILQFLVASVLLTLSPGPDIIYVLVTGLSRGKKQGLLLSLGLVLGILVHTSLVAFGVSALITASDILFLIIKLAGAFYLLYLAFKIYQEPASIELKSKPITKTSQNYLKQGFLMNVLNPKVTLFFMAFFPQFLWNKTENTIFQFYFLGFIFMLQAFIIFGVIAIFAHKFYNFIQNYSKSAFIFKYLQITVFVGIALYIIFSHDY
ncbi:LysE family translocator [Flavobacterium sp. CS20]|uniref:LysE family translocator n=1 Tax=Flavobacterium sp. CS20 TaxID=2775246 RepID=UPI001B3A4355|nr:LysE family translocator [Flavobacterium sp. CS20]QTY26883.1 LysE family translocator [Flavobacterium sp. CS20]